MNKNSLFLYKSPTSAVCVAIGNGSSKRRVWITDDEALQLAYRLMALAKGGETHGMEQHGS